MESFREQMDYIKSMTLLNCSRLDLYNAEKNGTHIDIKVPILTKKEFNKKIKNNIFDEWKSLQDINEFNPLYTSFRETL